MKLIEAKVIDETHLELEKPLPKSVGKLVALQIFDSKEKIEYLLKKLEDAYLSMANEDKKREIEIAEEALEEFGEEEEEKWW